MSELSPRTHRNKTFASFLAAFFGGFGLHRFYVHGSKDFWGWAHFASAPMSLLLVLGQGTADLFQLMPFVISSLVGILTSLILGLTPDEKWDAMHNPASGKRSASGWPLAVLLVTAFGLGAVGLMTTLARGLDLWLTGGAYG